MELKTVHVNVAITPSDADKLRQCADFLNLTQSDVIRLGMQSMFDKHLGHTTPNIEYVIGDVVTRILKERGL